MPDGVFNVVHGDPLAVDRILEHPGIAAVSFVGSTPVARHVYETGAAHGKRVQALGGAKNHMVVLPDADMELAADSAVNAAFGSAGQRCGDLCSSRSAMPPTICFRSSRSGCARSVWDGMDPDSEMGPLVTAEHHQRVTGYLDEGLASGARLAVDGRGVEVRNGRRGYFLGPCSSTTCDQTCRSTATRPRTRAALRSPRLDTTTRWS